MSLHARLIGSFLMVLAASLSGTPAAVGQVWGGYTPHFPSTPPYNPLVYPDQSTGGWLGADGPYETQLDSNRSLWAFSDSYLGGANATNRLNTPADPPPGNSIAIVNCNQGVYTLKYFAGGTSSRPAAFFDDSFNHTQNLRFWPRKAFMYNGQLYVFLIRVSNIAPNTYAGTVVARISNPGQSPLLWQPQYLTLTTAGNNNNLNIPIFGNEAFTSISTGNLFIHGGINPGSHQVNYVAIYIPLSSLETTPNGGNLLFDNMNNPKPVFYLNSIGTWSPGYQGPDYWTLDIPTTSGYSTRFNTSLGTKGGMWQCVFMNTEISVPNYYQGYPPYASIMFCAGPFGKWSNPVNLPMFPEMTPGNPQFTDQYNPGYDNIIYSVREVTDFENDPSTQLRLTYTLGSHGAQSNPNSVRQVNDMSIYVPKSILFTSNMYNPQLGSPAASPAVASSGVLLPEFPPRNTLSLSSPVKRRVKIQRKK